MTTPKMQTLDEILSKMDDKTISYQQCSSDTQDKPLPIKSETSTPKTKKQSDCLDSTLTTFNTPSDTLATPIQTVKHTPTEPIIENNKDTNRLRWLAFYYLSKKELSSYELKQKLLNKNFESAVIDTLIAEFQQKDYQSDYRCAGMLIRESIRKNRGKHHINQLLWKARINLEKDLGCTLDDMIDSLGESLTDGTILDTKEINWLQLAVEARTKKYGNTIPTAPKEKARQLRFLQYRGFTMSVCLDALTMTLTDFDTLSS